MNAPFRFAGRYDLLASREVVLARLRDADQWPRWWPQVRSVERVDDTSGVAHIRSVLPVTLHVGLTSDIDDPDAGVLRARLSRDLDGWIEFRVDRGAAGTGTTVSYDQECHVARPLLRRIAPIARPVLSLNHAAMMRSGMRGLGRPLPLDPLP